MEFQIAEAIELIKTLAETENLTQSQALTAFVAEAGMGVEDASVLKAALFETYTLQEMASDSLTKALTSVFVAGESGAEDIQEVDTKETQEGTKYKVRVKDRSSGSTYSRYATRAKIAELRANPNIASVELSDYGDAGEDRDGQRTAAAKSGKDYDGDGKKESSSKEHAGVVHNAIQRKMGGKPDGQDTRKEEFASEAMQHRDAKTGEVTDKPEIGKTYYPHGERQKSSVALRKEKEAAAKNKKVEEGIDFKGARREDDRREKIQKEKDKKSPSSKDYRLAMGKFRPGASNKERAEGGRDVMREKGTSPTKKGKKMFEAYLEARAALKESQLRHRDAKTGEVTDKPEVGKTYYTDGPRQKSSVALRKEKEAAAKKKELGKEDQKEGYVIEADLVDAGRENQGQRDKKKLTGKGVDNSTNVKLMPVVDEAVIIENDSASVNRVAKGSVNEALRSKIKEMAMQEECCSKCGTSECTCEEKKSEKKKKKIELDEAGMPIMEYSRNNATGPTKEMIAPEKDPEGEPGVMNPKGKPKRPQGGDRRPNADGPDLPNEKGTVPNGSGV